MSKLLETSYNESIERIVGCGATILSTFKLPTNVKEKRKKFWDELFCRYNRSAMEESDDETYNFVQFWVNTGYMPYNSLKSTTRVHSSSSSSLDTTAYILSNANITNKAETMAIVEGAKHNTINCQTTKHAEMTQVIPNEMYRREHKNSTFNDNDNYCEQYSQKTCKISNFLLQPKDTNSGQNITLDVNNDVNTLPEVVNMDGKLINRFNSSYNKSPDGKITCVFDNSQTRNPSIKQTFTSEDNIGTKYRKKLYTGRDSPIDLINMRSINRSKIYKLKQNLHPALDHEYKYKLSKKCKMKKIRKINQTFTFYNNLINNNSFSALSPGKRMRRKKKPDFNKISKMDTSLDTTKAVDTLSVNNNIENNSIINEILVEDNSDYCSNTSLLINESTDETTTNCTFNKSIDHLKREFKNVIKRSTNVNPVVHLVRLSEDINAKYLGSKKAMEVLNTSDITESSKFNDKYSDLKKPIRNVSKNVIRKSTSAYPVVRLVRLSEDVIARHLRSKKAIEVLNTTNITGSSKFNDKYRDLKESIRSKKEMQSNDYLNSTVNTSISNIQKNKKPNHIGMELNPVVYIEPLCRESRIQKYKKSTRTKTNFENFNPAVMLKKSSKSNIRKTMELQNNNMNTFKLTRSSTSNNSKSTLDAISPMYKEPTSPRNIKTRKSNTFCIDHSSTTSTSLSTCSTQSFSTTAKVSNKRTFKREKKIAKKGRKLNKKVTNRTVRSTGTSSSYETEGESDKSNSSSRVHKVLDVATSLPWHQSNEDDGDDYEKFITLLIDSKIKNY